MQLHTSFPLPRLGQQHCIRTALLIWRLTFPSKCTNTWEVHDLSHFSKLCTKTTLISFCHLGLLRKSTWARKHRSFYDKRLLFTVVPFSKRLCSYSMASIRHHLFVFRFWQSHIPLAIDSAVRHWSDGIPERFSVHATANSGHRRGRAFVFESWFASLDHWKRRGYCLVHILSSAIEGVGPFTYSLRLSLRSLTLFIRSYQAVLAE